MKYLWNTFLFTIAAVLLSSCSKEKVAVSQMELSAPMSYKVKRENLIKELSVLTDEEVNSEFLSRYPNACLSITPSANGEGYVMTIDPNQEN